MSDLGRLNECSDYDPLMRLACFSMPEAAFKRVIQAGAATGVQGLLAAYIRESEILHGITDELLDKNRAVLFERQKDSEMFAGQIEEIRKCLGVEVEQNPMKGENAD
jgi:hypothetical protein